MRRAAVYARVSTDRQETRNQLQELRRFVDRHDDWRLAGEYIDEESGGTSRRSDFRRLLDDAHQRKFDLVVFWALDRFSREGTRATINYLHELETPVRTSCPTRGGISTRPASSGTPSSAFLQLLPNRSAFVYPTG